jgi:hypothetical protein
MEKLVAEEKENGAVVGRVYQQKMTNEMDNLYDLYKDFIHNKLEDVDNGQSCEAIELEIHDVDEKVQEDFLERRKHYKKFITRQAAIYKKTPLFMSSQGVGYDDDSFYNRFHCELHFKDMSAMQPVIAVNVEAGLILVSDNVMVDDGDVREGFRFERGLLDRELFDSLAEPTSIYQFIAMCRESRGVAIKKLDGVKEEFYDFEERLKECKAKRKRVKWKWMRLLKKMSLKLRIC